MSRRFISEQIGQGEEEGERKHPWKDSTWGPAPSSTQLSWPTAYFAPDKMDSCTSSEPWGGGGADNNVRSMTRDLHKLNMWNRIESVGDLLALKAKYHLAWLVRLRNRIHWHKQLFPEGFTLHEDKTRPSNKCARPRQAAVRGLSRGSWRTSGRS